MKHQRRLDALEREHDKVLDHYMTGAPLEVLEAIAAGDYLPTWKQVITHDYQYQE